ncbi:MAG: alpha/beta hydrolase [Anaerolineales bacterium]|nr:alpha/beta hydrolase [Anaerolineales bacterium]
MKKTLVSLVILVLFVGACAAPTAVPTATTVPTETVSAPTESVATEIPQEDTASRLERLGGYPCPDNSFTCINVTVPLDHFDPQDGRTIDVVFAVQPASGERKGMFVTVIGGPGGSGLLSAENYTSYFDPRITENFDIVFFDQRGINMSGGLFCVNAATEYYRTDTDATTPEGEDQLREVTQKFVDDCVSEMGETDLLPYLDTVQAVEDLESFRELMGDEKFWLYGESYGTQFGQIYAKAHPDHIAGLILDGTVDLTQTDIEFLKGQAAAFNDVLVATLEACNADEACAADMGRDALTIYDELSTQLKQAPATFEYTLPNGAVEQREFNFADLESASGFLYSETARMIFLRALASYARDGSLVPLARVVYNALYINPDTQDALLDPSWSDAIYYGVTCRDYAEPGKTPEEQASIFIKEGDEVDTGLSHFSSVFYGDFPCVYWPYPADDSNPAPFAEPFTGDGHPTLVLNGTTDPATPYEGAKNVFTHLSDGYMVTETGGPHVIFGWGNECVDTLVTDFLVEGKLPAERETVCEGVVADDFVPLALADASGYKNPLDALADVDNEIYYLPEHYYVLDGNTQSFACPYGGTFAYESSDTANTYQFDNCAFSDGFALTGNGSYIYDDSLLTFEVDVTGLKDGSLTYTRDSEWAITVAGVYDGEKVDLSK